MSLTVAMRNAISGLNLNQFGLALTSNNISNVNTPGYSAKILNQVSRSANGIGSGVDIANVTRRVNDSLIKELRTQMGKMGLYTTQNDFLDRLQPSFGVPGSTTAVNANIGRLAASFEALGTTPESAQAQLNVITDATKMAQQINAMANSAQNMRAQADQDIAGYMSKINSLATEIDQLNDTIVRDSGHQSAGQSITDAEDRRDQAVRELSELVDVSTYKRSDGRMMVVIAGGYNLVSDGTSTLAYSPATAVSPATTFNPITVDGIGDITTKIRSGKLKALVDIRDTTMPNYMAQLDSMSLALRDRVNAAHNKGTTVPAQNVLTGTKIGLAGATAIPGGTTGTARFSITDATGKIVANADVNMAGIATVGALITAINTAFGANGTASINASGQLVIQATNPANGVAINENDTIIGGGSGPGVSSYFGMNDFFIGTDDPLQKGDLALALSVNSTLVGNPGYVSRSTLSMTALAGESGVAPGDGTAAQRLAATFTTQYSYAASGGIPAMNSTLADYAAAVISYSANQAAQSKNNAQLATTTMDSLDKRSASDSGVSIDEEMSHMVVLQNAYNASAQVIRTVNAMFDELEQILR